MCKEFGVKYSNSNYEDGSFEGFVVPDGSSAGLYQIHPDSLHILEPQVGDLIGCGTYALYVHNTEIFRHHSTWTDEKIIQRNDKAFFWPEVENV